MYLIKLTETLEKMLFCEVWKYYENFTAPATGDTNCSFSFKLLHTTWPEPQQENEEKGCKPWKPPPSDETL